MAGDWIKMRTDAATSPEVVGIATRTGLSQAEAFLAVFHVAAWMAANGDQGKIPAEPCLVDDFLGVPGFADAAIESGCIRYQNGVLTMHRICSVSATRKGLGRKLRAEILADGACLACGTTSGLVVDHIVPVSRGGTCARHNLQPLCQPCNSRKGTKTMAEFMGEGAGNG